MTLRSIWSFLISTPAAGLAVFVFSAGFPLFDDATEVDLTLHMLQHVLIIFAGVMVAYPMVGRKIISRGGGGWRAKAAFVFASGLIMFWHFPAPWDAAVLNPLVHVVEHLSFLVVGVLAGSWILLMSDSGKIGALVAAFFGHMGYAVALISPWNVQVYSLYPLRNQTTLGWVLLLTGPSLVAGVVYLLARNPAWLGQRPAGEPVQRKKTFVDRAHVPRWVAPALTFVLVASMAGYVTYAVYAVSGSGNTTHEGPVVFIEETPVTWQYSPQDIRVVIGVNATVQWVSHSLSYDTVTDRGGAFSSGPIAPGSAYSYSFTVPGEYSYYCVYHPWMSGTVVVVAQGQ